METDIFIFENYRQMFPGLKGRELSDRLIERALSFYGLDDVTVAHTDKGKPYAAGTGIYVSASHSGAFFACAVSPHKVGIDIQEERKASVRKIADRYFTAEEQEFIKERGGSSFFFLWTRKEALCKLTGNGMADIIGGIPVLGRDDVSFTDFQLEEGIFCSCCISKGESITGE